MNDNTGIYIATIIGATATILAGIIGALITSSINKKIKDEKDNRIDTLRGEIKKIQIGLEAKEKEIFESKKEIVNKEAQISTIKEALKNQLLIDCKFQYVLLCGPRGVGKTSLARRLYSPWDNTKIHPSASVRTMEVPVINLEADELIAHPAMSSIKVKKEISILLKVYDFPGDIDLQKDILRTLTAETTESLYGVVLIFMFDASEVNNISVDTLQYYSGDLFKNLKMLQATQINIARIILVFNKFDKLKDMHPNKSATELIKECADKFTDLLRPIHGAVNPEKVCEIAAILEEKNPTKENMGTSMIKGEAAREIVKKIDSKFINSIITENASINAAKHFQQ